LENEMRRGSIRGVLRTSRSRPGKVAVSRGSKSHLVAVSTLSISLGRSGARGRRSRAERKFSGRGRAGPGVPGGRKGPCAGGAGPCAGGAGPCAGGGRTQAVAGQCAAATGYGGFLLVSGHGLGQGSLEVTPKKLEGKLAPWVGTLHPLRRHTTWVLCMLPDVHHGHAPGEASASPPTLASTTRRMKSSRPLLVSPKAPVTKGFTRRNHHGESVPPPHEQEDHGAYQI